MAKQILKFFKSESIGGTLLFLAAILATIIENSSYREFYRQILSTKLSIGPESLALKKTLSHWIDDFLMVFFFLIVGLELKREWLEGELRSIKRVMLPGIAALGGMIVPALIFILINHDIEAHQAGWAIPAATDIAFSLAILSILGKRVPHSLRIFLTSLAIFDDLGAIVIIALFYSTGLSIPHLVGAGVVFILMLGINRLRVSKIAPYLILGGVLWYLTLKSGVHATIAGVLLAFTIPAVSADGSHSPLKRLEHALHPWVAFLVLPVFAFANGGLSFESISLESLGNPLALGVLLGLFVGKQLGVFAASWIALKVRIAPMPTNSTWGSLYGISLITGIGFTMSLFIGALAFPDSPLAEVAKAGTIVGSLLSAAAGYLVLRIASVKS